MTISQAFTADEATFLAAYRDLCERHGMCPVVESEGHMGLISFSENRIWGCTAGQMVDKQIEEIAQVLKQLAD